jgi:hypothetical protein
MKTVHGKATVYFLMLSLLLCGVSVLFPSEAIGSCAAPRNAIEAENCIQGNPSGDWDISGAGDLTIQGFATDISVNRGETIRFKVMTDADSYRLDIYRIGYYGGSGARKITTVLPTAVMNYKIIYNSPNLLCVLCDSVVK